MGMSLSREREPAAAVTPPWPAALAARGRLAAESAWSLVLGGAFLATLLLLGYEATFYPARQSGVFFPVSLGTALALAGFVAHLGIGRARRQLSLAWPGLWFPLVFALFHFASLGDRSWYAPLYLPRAWAVSVAGFLAWMAGYDLVRGRLLPQRRARALSRGRPLDPRELRRITGWGHLLFLAGLGLQFLLIGQIGLGAFLFQAYSQSKEVLSTEGGGALVYAFGLGRILCATAVIAAVVPSCLAEGRLFRGRVFPLVLLLYVAGLFLTGDRSELAVVLFPLLLCRHYFVKPIPWRQAIFLAAAGWLFLTGAKGIRETKSLETARSFVAGPGALERAADELGFTLDTVIRSMTLVPERQPYFDGMTYVHAAARAVPALGREEGLGSFVSSSWITRETAPEVYARHGGLGFSIVAEAYINFGTLGVPLLLFLLGLLHGRTERWICGPAVPVWLAMAWMVLEVRLLYHVRNTTVSYVRGSIWMLLLLAFLYWVCKLDRGLRAAPRPGGPM